MSVFPYRLINPEDIDRVTNAVTGHEVLDLTAVNRSLAALGENI
jgi:hypothetical protein